MSQRSPDNPAASLSYSSLKTRWPWKAYFLGVVTPILSYLVLYVMLRLMGVYHPVFNQGSWDIDGSTGAETVDALFFPAQAWEGELLTRFHLRKPPTGG